MRRRDLFKLVGVLPALALGRTREPAPINVPYSQVEPVWNQTTWTTTTASTGDVFTGTRFLRYTPLVAHLTTDPLIYEATTPNTPSIDITAWKWEAPSATH